ncbi:MAG: hypothetical protein JRH11_08520 [Deltaproteobacteria bacterium]|nr:hypothetical protein [Deltaproteobacteria bacterium]
MPFRQLTLALLTLVLGCDPDGEESGTATTRGVPPSVGVQADAALNGLVAYDAAWIDAVRIGSADFTLDLSAEPVPESVGEDFDVALSRCGDAANALLSGATALLLAADAVESLGTSSSSLTAGRREPLLLELAITSAIVLAVYKLYSGSVGAFDTRLSPIASHLAGASEEELVLYRRELGLDDAADRDTCITAFTSLPVGQQLAHASAMEFALATPGPGIRAIESTEITAARTDAVVQIAVAGVRANVGLSVAAIGTPGWGEAARVTGQVTAATADAITLTATIVGVQPTDLIDKGVSLIAVSDQTEPVEIAPGGESLGLDPAYRILRGDMQGDRRHAASRIARQAAGGASVGDAPVRIYASRGAFDDANESRSLLPTMGEGEVLVASRNFPPEVHPIDTSADEQIVIRLDRVVPPGAPLDLPEVPPAIPSCPAAFVTSSRAAGIEESIWFLVEYAPVTAGNTTSATLSGLDPGVFGAYRTHCRYQHPGMPGLTTTFSMSWMPYEPAEYGLIDTLVCHDGYVPDAHEIASARAQAIVYVGTTYGPVFAADATRFAQDLLVEVDALAFPCSPPS